MPNFGLTQQEAHFIMFLQTQTLAWLRGNPIFLAITLHVSFLGMPVKKLMSTTFHQEFLSTKLLDLLTRVDSSPVTTKQKLRLFRDGICPHLTWDFRVLELSISFVERQLLPKATKFLKKWLRIPQGGNSHVLYLPKKNGGLQLPALTTLYKQQQASRCVLFKSSQDNTVRSLEANTRMRCKGRFCPTSIIQEVQNTSTASTKQQLKTKVSQHILDMDTTTRKTHLNNLKVQGRQLSKDTNLSY